MTERMNWTIVPTEPSDAMQTEAERIDGLDESFWTDPNCYARVYAAMLSTTPDPLQDEGLVEKLARVIYDFSTPHGSRWEWVDPHYQETIWRERARRILSILSGKSEKAE